MFTFVLSNVFKFVVDIVLVVICPNLTLFVWFCDVNRRVSLYTDAYTNTITEPGSQNEMQPAITEKY